jgi:hypothetical protein
MSQATLNVTPLPTATSTTTPDKKKSDLTFTFTASPDNINLNLLILLHGLGKSRTLQLCLHSPSDPHRLQFRCILLFTLLRDLL